MTYLPVCERKVVVVMAVCLCVCEDNQRPSTLSDGSTVLEVDDDWLV